MRVRVCLHNEAPNIGCGWRALDILSQGPKWVKVRCPHTGAQKDFKRKVWDSEISKGMKIISNAPVNDTDEFDTWLDGEG